MSATPEERSGNWRIYRGTAEPHDGIDNLPDPPRWRTFVGGPPVTPDFATDLELERRLGRGAYSGVYRPVDHVIDMTNAALYLRKPLLVSGSPGSGKSTLAYSIAEELKLGPVLHWPITSRSTLTDALYRYDAIGRLQEANLHRVSGPAPSVPDIGRFIRLGPLGAALLPQLRPRVVLIDEIDKSDVDLPSDLLHILDTGEFSIPELSRLPADQEEVSVLAEGSGAVTVRRGLVRCRAFPIVIITSNGERALPPAFLRRCLQVEIAKPDREQLANIIEAQLGPEVLNESSDLIERFMQRGLHADLATDQLINAIYLATSAQRPPEASRDRVIDSIFSDLGSLT